MNLRLKRKDYKSFFLVNSYNQIGDLYEHKR